MNLRDQVVDLLKKRLLKDRPITFADDASFMEEGILDSLGMVELVASLEGRFGIKVDDEEFTPENLDSIDALVAFLRSKGVAE